MEKPKPIIGLSGGIASGKSLVAEVLSDLGAGVISSDRLNHQVLHHPDVRQKIQEWWGAETYDMHHRVNRRLLADIIFSDEGRRQQLENLTHPAIHRIRQDLIQQFQQDPTIKAIVLDSPLLFEKNLNEACDCVLFVDAPDDHRLDRVIKTRGWDCAELQKREKMQIPLDKKRQQADYIVENNSDTVALRHQVEAIFTRITH